MKQEYWILKNGTRVEYEPCELTVHFIGNQSDVIRFATINKPTFDFDHGWLVTHTKAEGCARFNLKQIKSVYVYPLKDTDDKIR